MNDVVRVARRNVVESPRKGFWIHAGDFNQKTEQGLRREKELQQRLTAADERADTATSLILRIVANFEPRRR